jgi:hypothetical protein
MSIAFSPGKATHIIFCVQPHQLLELDLSVQERETSVAFCVQQHNSLKFELCHQDRETLVAFCCSSIIL